MILFADTSALIKLYIAEPGSESMQRATHGALLTVSPLAYAESYATFARRRREGLLDPAEHQAVCDAFEADWPGMAHVPFQPEVLLHVPRVCQRHALRGADALQLASALMLHVERIEVTFATSDHRLRRAAEGEGLEVLDPAG